LATFGKKTDDI
jgi:hypothetical protein